jgi:hypothetical protein
LRVGTEKLFAGREYLRREFFSFRVRRFRVFRVFRGSSRFKWQEGNHENDERHEIILLWFRPTAAPGYSWSLRVDMEMGGTMRLCADMKMGGAMRAA